MVTAPMQQHIPPYMSFSTFTTFLDWIKEMPTTPSQIDRSLWETKFSGSVGSQVVSGMRFLALIDGNRPTKGLDDLARADNGTRKTLLKKCMRQAYGDEMVDGLSTYTPAMFDQKLRELGTTDATHQKASSFFINAGRYADIEIPTPIRKRARNRPPRAKAPKSKSPMPRGQTRDEPSSDSVANVQAESPQATGLRPIVSALIEDLKASGNTWDKAKRDSWLTTFSVALDYAYPAMEPNDQQADETA